MHNVLVWVACGIIGIALCVNVFIAYAPKRKPVEVNQSPIIEVTGPTDVPCAETLPKKAPKVPEEPKEVEIKHPDTFNSYIMTMQIVTDKPQPKSYAVDNMKKMCELVSSVSGIKTAVKVKILGVYNKDGKAVCVPVN